nr:NosD domain-containing protein [Candidatus Sigynarchaeota archaeon]
MKKIIASVVVTIALFSMIVAGSMAPVRVPRSRDFPGLQNSDATPYPRHAPILVTSDAGWAALASSGDGSPGTPWVIKNYVIECNGSGSGIIVTGTTDHVLIQNFLINETGSSGTDAGIGLAIVENLDIINVTINDTGKYGVATQAARNCTIINCTITNTALNCILLSAGSWDDVVDGNTLINASSNPQGALFTMSNCSNITIRNNLVNQADVDMTGMYLDDLLDSDVYNNTITCNASSSVPDCLIVTSGSDFMEISNNTFYYSDRTVVLGANNVTVDGNVFVGCNTIGVHSQNADDCNITSNQFVDCPIGVQYDTAGSSLHVYNNTFTNSTNEALNIGRAGCIVEHNYFADDSTRVYNSTDISLWNGNFYFDYFAINPYDVTVNTTTDILETAYIVDASITDPIPRYYAPWYPRGTMVYLNFFSSVNGLGIPFPNLHVELNGVPLTVTYPVIPDVLYHLNVTDFLGRSLLDEVFNLNETGIYVNIELRVAVKIWITYWSSLDPFNVDFDMVILYIDGVRCHIRDPIMEHELVNFTVTDNLNCVLYSQIWNLTATGEYVDIYLGITTVIIHNKFGTGVTFHYAYSNGSAEIAIPMADDQYQELRVALGQYRWWVTDPDTGALMHDINGTHYSNRTKVVVGPATIEFGFVQDENPIVLLAVFGAMFGLAFGGIVLLSYYMRYKMPKQQARHVHHDK